MSGNYSLVLWHGTVLWSLTAAVFASVVDGAATGLLIYRSGSFKPGSWLSLLGLDYLAVHPENKGQGIATALVESGTREAQKMGVGLFILAFEAALNVHLRLGFNEVDRVTQDDCKRGGKGWHTVLLVHL